MLVMTTTMIMQCCTWDLPRAAPITGLTRLTSEELKQQDCFSQQIAIAR
jgi:hypothetical protein